MQLVKSFMEGHAGSLVKSFMSTAYPPSRERLLAAATRSFAEPGYEQTETELLAGAAGLPVESITEEEARDPADRDRFRRLHPLADMYLKG